MEKEDRVSYTHVRKYLKQPRLAPRALEIVVSERSGDRGKHVFGEKDRFCPGAYPEVKKRAENDTPPANRCQ